MLSADHTLSNKECMVEKEWKEKKKKIEKQSRYHVERVGRVEAEGFIIYCSSNQEASPLA